MPHLKLEYSANLEAHSDMPALCAALGRALTQMQDGDGQPVFPLLGTRVLAYPAAHYAVADGAPERAFLYLNLRITPGRSGELLDRVGEELMDVVHAHCTPLAGVLALRTTLHIEEGRPVYEGKRFF